MKIYLDNAATTPLDPRVFESMRPYLLESFGNPSSIHSHGREARVAVEKARKTVAELMGAAPAEIFFTSGGTEADNTVLRSAIIQFGIRHVISSPIEHHAVIHTLESLQQAGSIALHLVSLDHKGHIDYQHLDSLLLQYPDALVSLMHANNEIGNITDIDRVGSMCSDHRSLFHSDAVQSVGYFPFNLTASPVHAIAASAHKFHGPKGIGFMYIERSKIMEPLLTGGGQERNMRGGTEHVAGIIGLARALELAYGELTSTRQHIENLKKKTITGLEQALPDVRFLGDCADMEHSHYKTLNIGLPGHDDNDMLLFNLDIQGISVSGGSACASGASTGSHVLEALGVDEQTGALRVSFSKYNTEGDVERLISTLASLL
jgi:cysteine desulfurase